MTNFFFGTFLFLLSKVVSQECNIQSSFGVESDRDGVSSCYRYFVINEVEGVEYPEYVGSEIFNGSYLSAIKPSTSFLGRYYMYYISTDDHFIRCYTASTSVESFDSLEDINILGWSHCENDETDTTESVEDGDLIVSCGCGGNDTVEEDSVEDDDSVVEDEEEVEEYANEERDEEDDDSISTGAVVGTTLGVSLIVILLIIVGWFMCKPCRKAPVSEVHSSESAIYHTNGSTHGYDEEMRGPSAPVVPVSSGSMVGVGGAMAGGAMAGGAMAGENVPVAMPMGSSYVKDEY